ncbi:MAG: dihydropyrimidine dehydrogenase [Lachnospiraceae bacterium]|nr:dihydropyrimidine dehydrogenase [Lachnospiraceae bacterium]
MSKTKIAPYAQELEKGYDLRRAMEEASRCLLCHDAPCSKGCPAGTDPAKFIRSLRFRNVWGAAETVRENNPLAGCCANVCPYDNMCEKACSRTGIDKPINIGKIQRFLVEQEKAEGMNFMKPEAPNGKKVACIGAGPSSLACARELALKGFDVTVFETNEKAGGMLTYGILPSRLPQNLVDFDLETIEKAGVKFEFNHKVTMDEIEQMKKDYDAVYVGVGLWQSKSVDVPGTDFDGVVSAIDFLKGARSGDANFKLGENVVVIGGGDVAMDCVSTAKQLGATATIVYRRTIEEAPANMDEVTAVQNMGVPIITQFAPEEIIGENGKVAGLKAKGRDGYSSLVIKADQIVFAIGQELAEEFASLKSGDGLYMGGDMLYGRGRTVVEAVADGKEMAAAIAENLK